jgi:hypothetical protein
MSGERKPFDQANFEENDPDSRRVVRAYFARNSVALIDNPDKYGIDLVSPDGFFKVEVERRGIWTTKDFPFNEVNLPERKAKFFKDNNTIYAIVSNDYTRIGIILARFLRPYIEDSNLRENPNRYVHRGELFFKIPRAKFRWLSASD